MNLPISMVIPTCNRKQSLLNTLQSAALQTFPPAEIIIVDASAEPQGADTIARDFPTLPVRYFTSRPSVCVQRNLGVKLARHDYVFLCDDDVEMPADYLLKLATYLTGHNDAGVVSGLFLQKDQYGNWEYEYRSSSMVKCTWNFAFQLSCWGGFDLVKPGWLAAPLLARVKKWYKKRGNNYSLAGWPLLTAFSSPVTRTSVYTLGAALVKREWLLQSPFEEKLVPNGIGDNYGVTLNMPVEQPVHLLTGAFVWHHHAPENRLKSITAYRYRIFALHHFMKNSSRFNRGNRLFLYWSLLGNTLSQCFSLRFNLALTSLTTLFQIASGNNPYFRKDTINKTDPKN